jgi:4-hydroxy-tetrahydrodipicolinate synthase
MTLFKGLSAFPITPTRQDGEVLTADLQTLIARSAVAHVGSIGLLGSTGTYLFLSRAQRARTVAAAVEAAGSTPVMVGIGAVRTDEAQWLARDAEREGAAGLLLAPVSYTALTDAEVLEHFRAVASVSDLPLCIYSNPSTTQFTFTPDLVAQLNDLPTVSAIKLPLPASGGLVADLDAFRVAAPDMSVGYSGDWDCAAALRIGADAWYSVLAGLFPKQAMALTSAAARGDDELMDTLNGRLEDLWSLFRSFGSLRVVYAAANELELTDAQPPRPLLALPPDARRRVETVVAELALAEG